MMKNLSHLTLAAVLCSLCNTAVLAQTPSEPTHRPRIGLVLGGGGARGAAHVGVLKVLERERIPVDFIAGTSMGAIVGGGYASGMSPAEIQETLNGIDWAQLFSDRAPRKELSFRGKRDERRFNGIEFGIQDGKVALPRGAMAGRKLEFLLKSVFLHTAEIQNFDQLGIPFRAVATDIETGNPVVLGDGSLAMAIRASMSIPGAFAPVYIDGHLVDGFVAKNVPIDVVKKAGVDVIIAVDVGTPLAKREKLNTLLDVVNQVSGIATIKNVQEQVSLLGSKDVLIVPDLGDRSVTDFDKVGEIIPLGASAADEHLAELRKYSVSEAEYQAFIEEQRRKPIKSLFIDEVRVVATPRVSAERIRSQVEMQGGRELDLHELSTTLDKVHSIGEFESVGFDLKNENGRNVLEIEPNDKPWGPHYFRMGLNLFNDFEGGADYEVLLDYTRTSLNDLGAEWQNEIKVGKDSQLVTSLYQPLDYGDTFFVQPILDFRQDIKDIYQDQQRIAEYRTRTYGVGADLGVNFATIAELRGGLWRGELNAERSTGDADLPDRDFSRGAGRALLSIDQTDSSTFPREGYFAQASGWWEEESLGADNSYDKYEGKFLLPV